MMNIQYAIADDMVYILEANPRASRTVPLVSKVCGLNMVSIATELLLGARLSDFDLKHQPIPHYGLKKAVFPARHISAGNSIPTILSPLRSLPWQRSIP